MSGPFVVDPRAGMDNVPRQGIPAWGNPAKHVPGEGSVRWRQRALAAERFIEKLEDLDRIPNDYGDSWLDADEVDALLIEYRK